MSSSGCCPSTQSLPRAVCSPCVTCSPKRAEPKNVTHGIKPPPKVSPEIAQAIRADRAGGASWAGIAQTYGIKEWVARDAARKVDASAATDQAEQRLTDTDIDAIRAGIESGVTGTALVEEFGPGAIEFLPRHRPPSGRWAYSRKIGDFELPVLAAARAAGATLRELAVQYDVTISTVRDALRRWERAQPATR